MELAGEIIEARENLARVEEELASLPPAEKAPSPAVLMAEGMSLDEAAWTRPRSTTLSARV